MKKLFMLLSLCVFMAAACEDVTDVSGTENNDLPIPPASNYELFITSSQDLSVSNNSGMGTISYTIANPVEGLSVVATTDVEWIHSFTYNTPGKIGFTRDASNIYEERVGVITITYGDASDTVTVTQAGKARLNEVAVTAPYILGHYFGGYANDEFNYYLVLSESNYDAENSFYAAGWKYFLDIYADTPPTDYTHIRVPNGVYTFNPNNDGRAGTFLEAYSLYKEFGANKTQIAERQYASGVLTVTDDLVKLEVSFTDGTDMHVVTYSGDYTMLDCRDVSGGVN